MGWEVSVQYIPSCPRPWVGQGWIHCIAGLGLVIMGALERPDLETDFVLADVRF